MNTTETLETLQDLLDHKLDTLSRKKAQLKFYVGSQYFGEREVSDCREELKLIQQQTKALTIAVSLLKAREL